MAEENLESVLRYDVLPLETKFDTTPDGFLQGSAIVTRTGVFTYVNQDGTLRYELRHPDEVFKADSLSTYAMKPITNDHPKGLVTPESATKVQVGSTGSNVRTDDGHIAVDLVITDAKTIKALKSGKREVSCGYRCDTIPEEGTYNGVKYTHVQKNIRTNHIAVVSHGRAGSVARIRMDGALAPLEIDNAKENGTMSELLKTINLDSVDYQAEAKVIEVLQSHKADAEDAKANLITLTAEKSKVEGEKDAMKAKLDAVEKELADLKAVHVDAADVPKLVQQRVALETKAKEMGVEVKQDMSDLDVMKSIIIKQIPKANFEGKDDSYVRGHFDAALELFAVSKEKQDDAAVRSLNAVKVDKADKPGQSYQEKRAEMVQATRNAHKKES